MTTEWETGAMVIDTARQRLGRVMDHLGTRLQLRPPNGGREWDADPAYVRPAMEHEILKASARDAKHRRTP
ncbi:hypothetical protein [Streptomyces sp. NRRL S-920]|uniref:hypothetical protein n=1 Tax=Streptomyces sp. NRRL S-920 TaxID=1463921 RepID=UPI0004C4B724|nr:hypothetical protein [Streptomyces sp. NRRL S-920]